jgi:hypothetical protein
MRATTSSQPTYRGDGALEQALGNAVGQVLRSTLVVLQRTANSEQRDLVVLVTFSVCWASVSSDWWYLKAALRGAQIPADGVEELKVVERREGQRVHHHVLSRRPNGLSQRTVATLRRLGLQSRSATAHTAHATQRN